MTKYPTIFRVSLVFASSLSLFAQEGQASAQKLPPVVVKGTAIGEEKSPTAPTLVLNDDAINLSSQNTIGSILAEIPGVSSSYFGPNASRPIVRGLEGDKLKITQNGTSTLDASSASPDHAVSVDPLTIRELQILRGPAALLYSSSILGGVVNVVDNRIPVERLPQQLTVSGRMGSVDGLRSSSLIAEGSLADFAFHLDGFKKTTENLMTPVGRIADTATDNKGAGFGVSSIGVDSYVGLSYSGLNSSYGVAEPDVIIGLRQRRWELAGSVSRPNDSFQSIEFNASRSDYTHTEFEAGVAGSTFTNQGWDSRIDLKLAKTESFDGSVGLQFGQFDFLVSGDEAFLPNTENGTSAAFGSFTQKLADPSLRLRYGFRIESAQVKASEWIHEGVYPSHPADEANFVPRSFSFALVKDLNPQWTSTLSLTTTERAPNYQELYADGPHVGTESYEVGNRNLQKEKGVGVELELAKVNGPVTGAVSLFYNRFSSFIILERNDYGPTTSGSDYSLGGADELKRYDFVSVPADFYGSEVKVNFQLQETPTTKLGLELFGDYVRASNRDTSEALPRISPGRIGTGLHGTIAEWNWRMDLAYHLAQNHIAPDETTTAGYTLLGASFSRDLKISDANAQFTLRLTNLLNREARNASSFVKDTLPLPGRGIEAGLKLTF
jgi:iron complex outermembrane receptor protein